MTVVQSNCVTRQECPELLARRGPWPTGILGTDFQLEAWLPQMSRLGNWVARFLREGLVSISTVECAYVLWILSSKTLILRLSPEC